MGRWASRLQSKKKKTSPPHRPFHLTRNSFCTSRLGQRWPPVTPEHTRAHSRHNPETMYGFVVATDTGVENEQLDAAFAPTPGTADGRGGPGEGPGEGPRGVGGRVEGRGGRGGGVSQDVGALLGVALRAGLVIAAVGDEGSGSLLRPPVARFPSPFSSPLPFPFIFPSLSPASVATSGRGNVRPDPQELGDSVAGLPVVRELLVRSLVKQAVTEAREPFRADAPRCCSYHKREDMAALRALGLLACISKAYCDEVCSSYHVDELLAGVAKPTWREWSRAWRPTAAAQGSGPSGAASSQSQFTISDRPTLGTAYRLLTFEAELPGLISPDSMDGVSPFEAREQVPLLRPAAVFLPPPEALARMSRLPSKEKVRLTAAATAATEFEKVKATAAAGAKDRLELRRGDHVDALVLLTSSAEAGAISAARRESAARAVVVERGHWPKLSVRNNEPCLAIARLARSTPPDPVT